MKEIWTYLSPFVAAMLAAGVTYYFIRRGKRDELATAERLAAFRVFHSRLLALSQYCDAFAAEIDGGDFEPRIGDLPASNRGSALLHWHDLRGVTEEYAHLLSKSARERVKGVESQLGLICSLNLTLTEDELHSSEAAAGYRRMAESARQCMDELYGDLGLPR